MINQLYTNILEYSKDKDVVATQEIARHQDKDGEKISEKGHELARSKGRSAEHQLVVGAHEHYEVSNDIPRTEATNYSVAHAKYQIGAKGPDVYRKDRKLNFMGVDKDTREMMKTDKDPDRVIARLMDYKKPEHGGKTNREVYGGNIVDYLKENAEEAAQSGESRFIQARANSPNVESAIAELTGEKYPNKVRTGEGFAVVTTRENDGSLKSTYVDQYGTKDLEYTLAT